MRMVPNGHRLILGYYSVWIVVELIGEFQLKNSLSFNLTFAFQQRSRRESFESAFTSYGHMGSGNLIGDVGVREYGCQWKFMRRKYRMEYRNQVQKQMRKWNHREPMKRNENLRFSGTRRAFIEAKYVQKAFLRPLPSANQVRSNTRTIKRWAVYKKYLPR